MTIPEYKHNSIGHEVQNCCCNTGRETWPQSKQEQERGRDTDTAMLSTFIFFWYMWSAFTDHFESAIPLGLVVITVHRVYTLDN